MTTDIYQDPGPSDAPPPIIPPAPPPKPTTPDKPRPTSAELDRTSTSVTAAQLNVSAVEETARVILGRYRVGAVIPWATVSGGELILMCIWGRSGPEGYDAIETISMNDAELPAGATVVNYLGNQTTVDPIISALLVAYGMGSFTDPLTGVCWSRIHLPDRDYSSGFPGGYPVNLGPIHAVVRGLKCYDPRNGTHVFANPMTWSWTDNPALITARIITDVTLGAGMTSVNAAFWTSVTDAANYDDGALTGAPGGTKRFTLNMPLQENAPADTHIKVLASYGGFWAVPDGGSYKFVIDGPTTAGAAITRANMIPGSFSAQGIENKDRPNLVFIRYTVPHPTNVHAAWRSELAPKGADIPSLPSGETRRVSEIDMTGITTYDQALRVAKERRAHFYLEDITMSFQLPQTALALFKGDVRPITYGVFSGKYMRILDARPNRLGYWDTDWQEYDEAAYSDAWTTAPSTPDTVLPDPNTPPAAVTGLVLTELTATNDSTAAPLSRIQATWTASASPYVRGYIVTVTDDASPPVIVYPPTEQSGVDFTSPPLPSPKKYRVNVAPVNAVGLIGEANSNTIFLTQGINTMHTIFSTALTSSGWVIGGGLSQTGLSFKTANYVNGAPSVDVRSGIVVPPLTGPEDNDIYSPIYDLGQYCRATIELDALKPWIADSKIIGAWIADPINFGGDLSRISILGSAFAAFIVGFDETGAVCATVPFDGATEITARYVRLYVNGPPLYNDELRPTASSVYFADWKIDLTGGTLTAKARIDSEQVSATSSATVPVTIPLANRYLVVTGVSPGAESTNFAAPTTETPVIGELRPNSINLNCFDAAGARIVRNCTVPVFGVRGNKTRTNWAAAANGATAAATSSGGGTPASDAIDGDLDSATGGYWEASGALPQTHTTTIVGAKPITEWVVIFLKDAFATPGQPTVFDTATLYHATSFTIEGWNGSAWITEQTITGNTKVMRRFPCAGTYSKGRCTITASPDGGARIVEFMAIGPA